MKFNKTLGVIVIGDEVLRGDVTDTNFAFIAKQAPSCGLRLTKVSIIPDVVEVIAKELQTFSKDYDVVVTSGGLGTTHDDRTFEAVASAFGEKLELHPSLLDCIASLYKCQPGDFLPNDNRLRLARVPTSSRLIFAQPKCETGRDPSSAAPRYPVLSVRNVFVLPGVPLFFQQGFNIIKQHIRDPTVEFFNRSLYCTYPEPMLAKRLGDFAEKHKDNLLVGSYPVENNRYYKVRVSLEAQDKTVIDEAHSDLQNLLRNELIDYEPDPVSNAAFCVYKMAKENSDFGRKLNLSLEVIENALNLYGPGKFILSFNGGKDCTALLHILFAAINKNAESATDALSHPPLLYVRSRSPFPEIEQFVQGTLHFYRYSRCSYIERHVIRNGMRPHQQEEPAVVEGSSSVSDDASLSSSPGLIVYEGGIKPSLARLKKDHPEIESVFMGTRSSDPSADSITEFMPTDEGWPKYIRVNPILDWSYGDVWHFLRSLSLPYCSLYDMGYTSLGSMEDTHPNPELRTVNAATGVIKYSPAYCLKNHCSERSGRSSARHRFASTTH